MSDIFKRVPPDFQEDLKKAIKILQEAGCTEIFIFGSVAHGKSTDSSDIDIAIKGCPKGLFFRLYGQLIRHLDHSIDLVDLDKQIRFGEFLQDHEDLVRVS